MLELPLGVAFARCRTRPAGRRRRTRRHRAGRRRAKTPRRPAPSRALDHGRGDYRPRSAAGSSWSTGDGMTRGRLGPADTGPRDLSTRPEFAAALRGRRPRHPGPRPRSAPTCSTSRCRSRTRGELSARCGSPFRPPTIDARVRRLWLAAGRGAPWSSWHVVGLVGFALARSITRPMRGARTGDRGPGARRSRGPRPADGGPPEVRALADAFNDMAAGSVGCSSTPAGVRGRRVPPAAHPARRAAAAAWRTSRQDPAGGRWRPRGRGRRDRPAGPARRRPARPWPAPRPPPPVGRCRRPGRRGGRPAGGLGAAWPPSRTSNSVRRARPHLCGRRRAPRAGPRQPVANALDAAPARRPVELATGRPAAGSSCTSSTTGRG